MIDPKAKFRVPYAYLALFAICAALIGCGTVDPSVVLTTTTDGTTRPAVFYGTNWNGGTVGPQGRLQRIRLTLPSGEVVQSATIRRSEADRADFLEVPAGQYLLEVRLFLDEDGEVLSGVLRQSLQVDGPVSVESSVGAQPLSLLVSPAEIALRRGESFRLGAALIARGALTFAFPDAISWHTSSDSVAISQDGLVVAIESGVSTVTAEHRSGLTGSSDVTVR